MEGQAAEREPYSYHTFAFPFILEDENENPRSFEYIVNYLKGMPKWTQVDYSGDSFSNFDKEGVYDYYRTMQYFHEPVSRAIYGNDVVVNYVYDSENIHNRAVYCIEKKLESKEELHLELNVNQIRLKIYDTGVGILVFECENIREHQRNLKTVKYINEYGRRVTTGFLPIEEAGLQLCADTISIQVLNENQSNNIIAETSFSKDFAYCSDLTNQFNQAQITYIAGFIVKILSYETDENPKLTTDRNNVAKDGCFLRRALDDRMYVSCLVRDKELVQKVREAKIVQGEFGEFAFCQNKKKKKGNLSTLKSLYELIFIDPPGGVSCPTERMMMSLLNKQVYDRWLEWGTFYGVSHHSFICGTGEDSSLDLKVVDPFLILYSQMTLLCLAQRCSIILFQKRAAAFTNGMAGHGYDLNRSNTVKLLELQENLVAFQNQLQFFEVTAQEQGIELYDMLCSSLYIEKEKKLLEEQISLAYQAATVNQGVKFSQAALVISITAMILTMIGSVTSLSSWPILCTAEESNRFIYSLFAVSIFLVAMLVWYIVLRRRRKK